MLVFLVVFLQIVLGIARYFVHCEFLHLSVQNKNRFFRLGHPKADFSLSNFL